MFRSFNKMYISREFYYIDTRFKDYIVFFLCTCFCS